MTKKLKRVTIDRKKWIRGSLNGESMLCNENGEMCCLGFAACQITKKPKKELIGMANPYEVFQKESFLTAFYISQGEFKLENSSLSGDAIDINDDETISEAEREANLIQLFREHGIILNFKN